MGWRNFFSSCAVCCVSFWFWREIGSFFVAAGTKFITTGKKKNPVVCLAGCAVVVLAITTGKKSSSRLSGGLSVFGSGDYDRKKKFQSSVWRVGSGDYDRKKKVPVVCLAGCAVASVFGSGDYNRKKKFQSSVWRVVLLRQFLVLAITTGKKKVPVVCLAGWFWQL